MNRVICVGNAVVDIIVKNGPDSCLLYTSDAADEL